MTAATSGKNSRDETLGAIAVEMARDPPRAREGKARSDRAEEATMDGMTALYLMLVILVVGEATGALFTRK